MLPDNKYYFDIALHNPEPIFDEVYAYAAAADRLAEKAELVDKIMGCLQSMAHNPPNDEAYEELRSLCQEQEAKHSPFGAFVTACDTTLAEISAEPAVFREVADLYIAKRQPEICFRAEIWIQAQADQGISRRGVEDKIFYKLSSIAKNCGFMPAHSPDDFFKEEKALIGFNDSVRDGLGLSKKLHDERLIALKHGDKFAVTAAKHLKNDGGAQNDQFADLQEFLAQAPAAGNIVTAAFLDGIYSNHHLRSKAADIESILADNTEAFWLNSAAFRRFAQDF